MSIPSPCINVCQLDPRTGLCEGCLRSGGEIARWLAASDAEKSAILEAVAVRVEAAQARTPAPHPPFKPAS